MKGMQRQLVAAAAINADHFDHGLRGSNPDQLPNPFSPQRTRNSDTESTEPIHFSATAARSTKNSALFLRLLRLFAGQIRMG